jgi:diaminohydroxyphosphoribosylaminopyrimidine deaminase/5-amino-6-(5-phosphoribosylamino)uracil reductase
MHSDFDSAVMRRCLVLAGQAAGQTSPNPLVGSVIVQNGIIVGEGYHHKAGQSHAEVEAIESAANCDLQGATLYVNLEPCNHHGRTPPCTEAILKAGIAKVVVGMVDPDKRVSGTGIAKLRSAGIEVVVGVEQTASENLNEAFIHRSLYQRAFGIYKYAMTLDGKIATNTGNSAWVSNSQSRSYVHHLRSTCDAVIVGGNTVRLDNPHLTTHQVTENNPLRVVLSKRLSLPLKANLWQQQEAKTLIFTQAGCDPYALDYFVGCGLEIIQLNDLTPEGVMSWLYQKGLTKVLWECGPTLAAAAIKDGAIQKILAFIAPKIIGGTQAPSPIADLGLSMMNDAINLEKISLTQIGADFLVEGYLSLGLK